jgi:hypothetical protein
LILNHYIIIVTHDYSDTGKTPPFREIGGRQERGALKNVEIILMELECGFCEGIGDCNNVFDGFVCHPDGAGAGF